MSATASAVAGGEARRPAPQSRIAMEVSAVRNRLATAPGRRPTRQCGPQPAASAAHFGDNGYGLRDRAHTAKSHRSWRSDMSSSPVDPPNADVTQAVDSMERMSGGPYPGHRRSRARGICFVGTFTPTGDAAALTTAAHLQHRQAPFTVRFSNSEGIRTSPTLPRSPVAWPPASTSRTAPRPISSASPSPCSWRRRHRNSSD